jgi:glycosyltransferase involved in cell wall biosynthesis
VGIKTLFVTHYAEMYGANKSLCTLIVELRDNYGIRPVVLLPRSGSICEFLTENNIKHYISPYYWWVNNNQGGFQRLLNVRKQFRNIFRIPKLVNLIKNEHIDLVYSNSITINIGYFLSIKLNCPHIWHIRESLDQFNFKFSLGNFLSKFFLKRGAAKYIVISDFLKNSYDNLLPLGKTEKVYNGVSLNLEERISNSVAEVLKICCVGVLCEQKNQLDVLRAICLLRQNGITNVRLHLIGSAKKEYLEEIRQYITCNNLLEEIVLHGHQTNVNELLATMNIGIMTSRDEAFGRVTVEYMLHKMPVIASISGANEEINKDGVTGFMYQLGKVEELSQKIKYFIDNPAELQRMGNAAQIHATTNFSSKQNSRAIYQIIKDLTAQPK